LTTFTQDALGALKAISPAHAILAAGLFVAASILFAASFRPPAVYMPNPQGGIWIRTVDGLFLCRAALDEPAPCFDMATGKATSYDKLEPVR
jgi:hypothetical protein